MEMPSIITDAESLRMEGEVSSDRLDASFLKDPVFGEALRAHLVLTHRAEAFVNHGWSAETVFWSRHFWFRRFIALRARSHGIDAGLEQQALHILEHPFPRCTPDWLLAPEVEELANAI